MRFMILSIALFFHLTLGAQVFYSQHEVPSFNKSERVKLNDFGILFRPFNKNSSIKKHNHSVTKLIDTYGDSWKDSLEIKMTDSGKEVKSFLKYMLLSSGGIDVRGKRISVFYKRRGFITCITTTKTLNGEGASMVHRRITTQTFDKTGKKIEKESRTIRGSGCCFAANTKVLMQDDSQKSIAELKVGDRIKTYNVLTKQLENAEVKQLLNLRHENLYELDFGDFKITTTADHPFLLKKGWGAISPELAKKYLSGDTCFKIELNARFSMVVNGVLTDQKLKSIKLLPQSQMTYTITELSNGDSFIANGLIVRVESLIRLQES